MVVLDRILICCTHDFLAEGSVIFYWSLIFDTTIKHHILVFLVYSINRLFVIKHHRYRAIGNFSNMQRAFQHKKQSVGIVSVKREKKCSKSVNHELIENRNTISLLKNPLFKIN